MGAGAIIQKLREQQERTQRRRALCDRCGFKDGEFCTRCGCVIRVKTQLAGQSCPIGKW